MRTKHRIAACLRNLPRPLDRWVCCALARRGLMSPWNGYFGRMGCPKAILDGPFAGMRYAPIAHGSQLLPKLLGTYEKEIAPWIVRALAAGPDLVVDVGAAEGYYAVGSAYVSAATRVVAYDLNPLSRKHLRRNARWNGLAGRVFSRGACNHGSLQADLSSARNPLLVSDCEGYEMELLDPSRVPALTNCTVIVEIHETPPSPVPAREALSERFAKTHRIEVVTSAARTAADWPERVPCFGFSDEEQAALLRERNSQQQWMMWTPLKPDP